ncbi:MAG: DUF5985 family protein [Steroidobacteraceae bacterium]
MAAAVYALGSLVSAMCALMLLRAYSRVAQKLLLWSGLCFVGLAISNVLLFVDLVIWTDVSLYTWRLSTAAVSMLLLLYGLIWEAD